MNAKNLAEKLDLEILSMPCPEKEVCGAYVGDLLSWVMGRAEAGCVWATIMTNVNVVAVASLVDAAITVICEGCEVPDDIVKTAADKGVNLVRTSLPAYKFCVELSKLI